MEMEHPDRCCGSAGVYSLTHPALALQVLQERTREVAATEADAVVTANPGCMLQLEAGTRLARLPVRVLHVAEVLAAAYADLGPIEGIDVSQDVGKR